MGVRRNFSWGGNVNIVINFLGSLTMQCKCTFTKHLSLTTRLHHKENDLCYNNGHKKYASLAAIARYIPIIFTIGYLQTFKAGYLFSQKYCHGLTNPQIMTLFYLARLVSSVAAGVSLVNIRLLPSSTSDFPLQFHMN